MIRFFRCVNCGLEYPVNINHLRCECGAPFELVHDCVFLKSEVDKEVRSIWRYRKAIPVEKDGSIVTLGEGFTPILPLSYKGYNIWVKLEYVSPTGSFKDRGASVLFSFLREIGVKNIVEDSSGNAGVSVSAYGARAGIECEIFCPEYTSGGKLIQISLYGAKLVKVKGSREDTSKAAVKAAQTKYYASHNWHPFFIEGLKTLSFEIVEQLNWNVPDNIVLPLGFGGLYYSLYLGFKQLLRDGIVCKIPRLFGVQSEMCCPLYEAFVTNGGVDPEYVQRGETIAEGICGAKPVFWKQIIGAVRETGGSIVTVSDREIEESLKVLLRQGFLVEPTSAVVIKGMEKFVEIRAIKSSEKTLLILTGSGLKTLDRLEEIFYKRHGL
ncbi:MAG TPA: pyridoxal-phosphate dependent enzyme [Candidatus Marinimicrobia bacterium]|nr:pyridoxal-phosphate dependent enzyme [Candidatus Neomarinimicrobiota bacterium]